MSLCVRLRNHFIPLVHRHTVGQFTRNQNRRSRVRSNKRHRATHLALHRHRGRKSARGGVSRPNSRRWCRVLVQICWLFHRKRRNSKGAYVTSYNQEVLLAFGKIGFVCAIVKFCDITTAYMEQTYANIICIHNFWVMMESFPFY